MGIWGGLRAVSEEWGAGTGQKKVKGSAGEHISMAHGHRQQCGDGQREGGLQGLGGSGQRGENGDTCGCQE